MRCPDQKMAFSEQKAELTRPTVLALYDPQAETKNPPMLPHSGLVLCSSSELETPGDLLPMPHDQCLKQKDVTLK